MADYFLIYMIVGLLLWAATILIQKEWPKHSTPQWVVAILFALLWPFLLFFAFKAIYDGRKE